MKALTPLLLAVALGAHHTAQAAPAPVASPQNSAVKPLPGIQKGSTGGADVAMLAFTPDSPPLLAERKTYVSPDGSFSFPIPQRFSVSSFDLLPGVTFTDFGTATQAGAHMGLTVAPARNYAAPGALLEFFKTVIAQVPAIWNFQTEAPQQITFRGQQATLSHWSDRVNGIPNQGSWLEWSEGDHKIALFWGGPPATGADALRPLFDSLKWEAQPAPAAPVLSRQLDELLATMTATNEQMGQLNERQERRSFATPQADAAPTAAAFEARDKKRLALPANSHERSQASHEAARVAGQLAWDASQRGDTATATKYFELRSQLDTASYHEEIAALQVDLKATEAQIAHWGSVTLPQSQATSYLIVLDSLWTLKGMQLSAWRDLAMVQGDTASMDQSSRQLFALRCSELEAARLADEPPQKQWQCQAAVAVALENMGDVAQERGDLAGGRAYFSRSLEWRQAIPVDYSRRDIYEALRNRGVLETKLGDLRVAREVYSRAITELEAVAPSREKEIEAEADAQIKEYRRVEWTQTWTAILNNLGVTAQNLGDYSAAEANLQKALKNNESLPETGFSGRVRASMRAVTLGNIAVLRADTGDLVSASDLLAQSAQIYRSIGNDSGLALTLLNNADINYQRGDYEGALQKTNTASQLFVQLQQLPNQAAADVFVSKIAHEKGDNALAVELAQKALVLSRTLGDADQLSSAARNLIIQRLNALGEAPLTPAAKNELEALLVEAQTADARSGSANGLVATLKVRANLQIKNRDLEGAFTSIQGAIAGLEKMRATTVSGDAFSEQESVYSIYDMGVSLLLKLKRPEEAFDLLSRARSKKLRDNLRLSALKSNDPALQKLLDRAAALDETLVKTRAQLASETALPAPQRDEVKLKNLTDLIASTQQEFFDVSTQIKARNPGFEKALALSPRELKKAQRAIPEGALLLQYAALDDGLYIFAVTRDSLQIYSPKVSKDELNKAIHRYRRTIDADLSQLLMGETPPSIDGASPLRSASETLSNWLLAPVQTQIDAAKTVAIIPSGELFYLPFHALGHAEKDGKWRFLIEDKPVAYLAAGDVLSIVQDRAAGDEGKGLLAMGDPTGADLPAARTEVESIARLFPESRALTGASASKVELLLPSSREKRVLHLAAHGVLNSARPDQSFIQLSPSGADDGRLRVGEIFGLDLNRVDLVTLSACRTALGEGEPDGSEISSLAESFSSAGTPSVVASLWNVEDQSTARLMETFYGALATGTPKGEALQKAQIGLLREPKTRHPLFWAPFELLGDWR